MNNRTDPAGQSGPALRHGPGPRLMGADTLIGNAVVNRDAESLGEIKEIMLDVRNGGISYAVLSFGGFMGVGHKLFAVPWAALRLDTKNRQFVLEVPKSRLELAPGFDSHNWPDEADPTWQMELEVRGGPRTDDGTAAV